MERRPLEWASAARLAPLAPQTVVDYVWMTVELAKALGAVPPDAADRQLLAYAMRKLRALAVIEEKGFFGGERDVFDQLLEYVQRTVRRLAGERYPPFVPRSRTSIYADLVEYLTANQRLAVEITGATQPLTSTELAEVVERAATELLLTACEALLLERGLLNWRLRQAGDLL